MATVPIVTEVTLAQLDALVAANGLNEGLQYKVTDKGWLLVATSNNTLKSLSGSLKIINGEVLSSYITTEVLFIDTGIIEDNISFITPGVPLPLIIPENYDYDSCAVEVLTNNDVLNNIKISDTTFHLEWVHFNNDYGVGKYFTSQNRSITPSDMSNLHLGAVLTADNNGGGNTFRCIIRFTRSYLI